MFISRHTLKWTKTCRSSGDFPHAHTAHFLLNRHIRHSMPAIVENCTQHIDGRLIIRPIIHDDDAFRANRLGQCRLDCFANQRTLIATGNYHCHCCHAASLSGSKANHPPALRATSRQRKVRFEQHHHQGNNNPLFCIILIEYDAENYSMMQKEIHNEAL